MTFQQLDEWLQNEPEIKCWVEPDNHKFYFKHLRFDSEGEYLEVTKDALDAITAKELYRQVVDGRNVDGITRITGYFTKIRSWNAGKHGELMARHRNYGIFSS